MGNETFGWISVLGGLGMGLSMGLKFQREEWLGGYNAFPRRMVRLAHVALVALGMLNIQFAQSLPRLEPGMRFDNRRIGVLDLGAERGDGRQLALRRSRSRSWRPPLA